MRSMGACIKAVMARGLHALLLFMPLMANATSCVGVNDKFFLQCSEGQCQARFRAREVRSFGPCATRVVVEPVSAETQRVLLAHTDNLARPGFYEVTLIHRFYGPQPADATSLAEAFDAGQFRTPRVTVAQLATNTDFALLRAHWVAQERKDLALLTAAWAIEFSLLGAALFISYRTVLAFRRRLRTAGSGRLVGPLALQLAIFLAGMSAAASAFGPMLITLIMPVLLIVWLYELVAYVVNRFKKVAD
jgi:hypothetical protein